MQDCALQGFQLHSVSPSYEMPVEAVTDRQDCRRPRKKEISWQAVYYHWQKWNRAGCFEQIWRHSLECIKDELDCTHVNLDGSHTIAKKGGEGVVYQHRKRAKTSNILPISDAKGFIVRLAFFV